VMRRRLRELQGVLVLVALATWVGGFELAPALHVAFHDRLAPHSHHAGGPSTSHSHGGADEADAHFRFDRARRLRERLARWLAPPERAVAPQDAPGARPAEGSEHGAHSLAHRQLASRPAAAGSVAVGPCPLVALVPVASAPKEPGSWAAVGRRARGPPRG